MITLMITKAQISKIHVLLSQFGLMAEKVDFIYKASNGRVTSTKELTMSEASHLLKHLSNFDPCERMSNKVFALAYEAGIIWGNTPADKKMNFVKINAFLVQYGTVKKEINKMTKEELVKVVSQFTQIIKHKEDSRVSKTTKDMLDDLGILTSKKEVKNPL